MPHLEGIVEANYMLFLMAEARNVIRKKVIHNCN